VYSHHESFDGSGYPQGLAGEDIPLSATLFALADTIDAMTSDRPYRQALALEEAGFRMEHVGHEPCRPYTMRAFKQKGDGIESLVTI
jgi:HD-GYP domain-containing protein (c-di-GMP phosphodiesterase class II)